MVDAPHDDVVAVLAAPLEEFVATRTARVKALKAEGRKEEAAALAAMRKPTRLVWTIGEVRRRHRAEVEAGDVAMTQVDEAQAAGGGALRQSLRDFRDAIEAIAALVAEIDGGVDAATAGLAVRAVFADADAHRAWQDGVLSAMPTEGMATPSSRATGSKAARKAPPPDERPAKKTSARRPVLTVVPPPAPEGTPAPEPPKVSARELRAARQATRDADAALARAERTESAARDEVNALEAELVALTEQLDEARTALGDTIARRSEAADDADRAHAALEAVDAEI